MNHTRPKSTWEVRAERAEAQRDALIEAIKSLPWLSPEMELVRVVDLRAFERLEALVAVDPHAGGGSA